uniref:Uncharacterized protein n=1 Tax=Pygocentrus nattereri TaxID=42514 RepID=A0AAR2M2R0_PYGNA
MDLNDWHIIVFCFHLHFTQRPNFNYLLSPQTVQIMIGLMTFMFGIVITIYVDLIITVYSGIAFWGALMYIITGSLAVAASNKLHRCVVKGALVMNVLSSIVAGVAIILLSLDFVISALYAQSTGINAVLLIFSIMQFIISICVSAFACKSTCKAEPSVGITMDKHSRLLEMNPVNHLNTFNLLKSQDYDILSLIIQ